MCVVHTVYFFAKKYITEKAKKKSKLFKYLIRLKMGTGHKTIMRKTVATCNFQM